MEKRLFTSESVTEGHPDKICDNISDGILDALMEQDPMSRVACETAITTDYVLIMGEITTKAKVDYEKIARETIREIGYDADEKGFNCDTCRVKVLLDSQSPDIAMGVDKALEARENEMSDEQLEAIGAGDQGMMFGYATNETEEMLPIPYVLSTKALLKLRAYNLKDGFRKFRPDAKAQVSFDYDTHRIDTFLISTQHAEETSLDEVREIVSGIMKEPAEEMGLNTDFRVRVNPTGRFVLGSSFADSGLTGRKIIADTYGGAAHHGGGAFSGKDPSKVDRSAAYMARKIARDIVNAGKADRCEVQLAYAIGVAEPVSVYVDCFGTEKQDRNTIWEEIKHNYDLTPKGITRTLDLRHVDYNLVSSYGHFGKSELPWEK